MTKSFEERFDERFPIPKIVKITKSEDTEGVITDYELKDFIRTELQKAREEERERIAVILQEYLESGYNDEILKKINQEDK